MCHKFQGRQYYCLERITILSSRNAGFEIVVLGVVQLMDEHKIFIRNYHGICFWILTSQGSPLSAHSMGCGLISSTSGLALGREGLAFGFHGSSSVSRAWLALGSLQLRAALLCAMQECHCWPGTTTMWSGVVLARPGFLGLLLSLLPLLPQLITPPEGLHSHCHGTHQPQNYYYYTWAGPVLRDNTCVLWLVLI